MLATTNPIGPPVSSAATNPENPCGGSIPSQPQDPNSTIGGNEGCNPGTPTLPNLEVNLPDRTTPARKQKLYWQTLR
ncbi:hypothetical protein AB4Y90_10760 [Chryseobacterium sp. 2TAF14]|uniref:hypothetical protein n=1 Tax=Chryseobacterium sp. 2TAF14 TaxID=3233007 RepID=UPI003F8F10A5